MMVAMLDRTAAAVGNEATILDRIADDDTHLALWLRTRPASLGWIDALQWDAIHDLDFRVAAGSLDVEVAEGLAEAGYPQDERGAALRDEIVSLSSRFAAVMGCHMIKIRLEVVETDACRKFHADAVTARLLTTLSGPGTQWIETAAPGETHQLSGGDVAILKGRSWAEEPLVLHRSPPMAGTGDTRLLLAIDPFYPTSEGDADHG